MLRYTKITTFPAEINHKLSQLEDLNLAGCRQLDEESLLQVLNGCGWRLQQLNLSYTRVTLAMVDRLLTTRLPCLRRLGLAHCKQLTEQGLASLLARTQSHRLRSIELTGANIIVSKLVS